VLNDMTEKELTACVVLRPGVELAPRNCRALRGARGALHGSARHPLHRRAAANPTERVEKFQLQRAEITADTWNHENPGAPHGARAHTEGAS